MNLDSFLKAFHFSAFKRAVKDPASEHNGAGRPSGDAEFAYDFSSDGDFGFIPPEEIAAGESDKGFEIADAIGLTPSEKSEFLDPLILSYASYVHLLPASERNHHRGPGGLFRHGLETSLLSVQMSRGLVLDQSGSVRRKREMETRWRAGYAVAGLIHDIGKPVSDVFVRNADGSATWNPFLEPLYDWGRTLGEQRYYLDWQSGRFRRHEHLNLMVLDLVLTRKIRGFLAPDYNREILCSLYNMVTGNFFASSLSKVVTMADQESAKRDLMSARLDASDLATCIPAERYILEAIIKLMDSGVWTVNQPGARVWVLDSGTYVNWRCAANIKQILDQEQIPAVPRNPDELASILLERGYAEYCVSEREGSEPVQLKFFKIMPDVPGTAEMDALKLTEGAFIFPRVMPPAIRDLLCGEDKNSGSAEFNKTADALNSGELETDALNEVQRLAEIAVCEDEKITGNTSDPENSLKDRPLQNGAEVTDDNDPAGGKTKADVHQSEVGKNISDKSLNAEPGAASDTKNDGACYGTEEIGRQSETAAGGGSMSNHAPALPANNSSSGTAVPGVAEETFLRHQDEESNHKDLFCSALCCSHGAGDKTFSSGVKAEISELSSDIQKKFKKGSFQYEAEAKKKGNGNGCIPGREGKREQTAENLTAPAGEKLPEAKLDISDFYPPEKKSYAVDDHSGGCINSSSFESHNMKIFPEDEFAPDGICDTSCAEASGSKLSALTAASEKNSDIKSSSPGSAAEESAGLKLSEDKFVSPAVNVSPDSSNHRPEPAGNSKNFSSGVSDPPPEISEIRGSEKISPCADIAVSKTEKKVLRNQNSQKKSQTGIEKSSQKKVSKSGDFSDDHVSAGAGSKGSKRSSSATSRRRIKESGALRGAEPSASAELVSDTFPCEFFGVKNPAETGPGADFLFEKVSELVEGKKITGFATNTRRIIIIGGLLFGESGFLYDDMVSEKISEQRQGELLKLNLRWSRYIEAALKYACAEPVRLPFNIMTSLKISSSLSYLSPDASFLTAEGGKRRKGGSEGSQNSSASAGCSSTVSESHLEPVLSASFERAPVLNGIMSSEASSCTGGTVSESTGNSGAVLSSKSSDPGTFNSSSSFSPFLSASAPSPSPSPSPSRAASLTLLSSELPRRRSADEEEYLRMMDDISLSASSEKEEDISSREGLSPLSLQNILQDPDESESHGSAAEKKTGKRPSSGASGRKKTASDELEQVNICLLELAEKMKNGSLRGTSLTSRGIETDLDNFFSFIDESWPRLEHFTVLSYLGIKKVPAGSMFMYRLGSVILKSSFCT